MNPKQNDISLNWYLFYDIENVQSYKIRRETRKYGELNVINFTTVFAYQHMTSNKNGEWWIFDN